MDPFERCRLDLHAAIDEYSANMKRTTRRGMTVAWLAITTVATAVSVVVQYLGLW